MAVLEWCKLFADRRGKHYWTKLVTDSAAYQRVLLRALQMSEPQFVDYVDAMRAYRDKFVAHLDNELVMRIPPLDAAKASASHLFDHLVENEDEGDFFLELPRSANSTSRGFAARARDAYRLVDRARTR